MSSSFDKSNLLQFDTDDIQYSHRTQKRKNKSNKSILVYSLIFITTLSVFITILKSYQANSISKQLDSIKEDNKELKDHNAQLNSYLDGINQQYNMFTDADDRAYQKAILNQIFYPHSSDILETIDELNLIRTWIGKATMRLIFKSSITGDSAIEFHKKVMKGTDLLFMVKTKNGSRFGGYTSKNFEPLCMSEFTVDTEKDDRKSFLFSLDKQRRFKVKDIPNALYCD